MGRQNKPWRRLGGCGDLREGLILTKSPKWHATCGTRSDCFWPGLALKVVTLSPDLSPVDTFGPLVTFSPFRHGGRLEGLGDLRRGHLFMSGLARDALPTLSRHVVDCFAGEDSLLLCRYSMPRPRVCGWMIQP